MNITQLKADINAKHGTKLTSLNMVRQFDETGKLKQPWLSHWDNDNRVRITMHEDVLKQVQENPSMEGLAAKVEIVPETPERASYTRLVVITPKNIEAVL